MDLWEEAGVMKRGCKEIGRPMVIEEGVSPEIGGILNYLIMN
jgi:hypothetical protein